MTIKKCPRCNRTFTIQPGTTDYIHDCDSGNLTIDNEDIFRLDANDWNKQGWQNKANTKATIMKADVEDRTRRGMRKRLYDTRNHEEYIKLR